MDANTAALVGLIIAGLALIANAFLAGITCTMAKASAGLVQETQRDRELAVQPFLIFGLEAPPEPTSGAYAMGFQNIGRGPALACSYESVSGSQQLVGPNVVYSPLLSHELGPCALGPGSQTPQNSSADYGSDPRTRLSVYYSLLTSPMEQGQFRVEALRCRDIFENQFLFVRGETAPRIFYADRRESKWWKHGDPEPAWTEGW
jgi:hypothetical protein